VSRSDRIVVRNTRVEDFPGIIELCRAVYPFVSPYGVEQLESQRSVFPEGQFVAEEQETHAIVGMAASLIVRWDDYDLEDNWKDFTDHGKFTNHDPEAGRTLYAAEVMVHPRCQGMGIGKLLYQARRELTRIRGLLRIRAGARLRGYHKHAQAMSIKEYARRVARREIGDPTVSFQMKQGFRIVGVVPGYLRTDPESLGYAAVIEWLNPEVASEIDLEVEARHDLGA
jgi:GNAT superfamily N-acetyltransferase